MLYEDGGFACDASNLKAADFSTTGISWLRPSQIRGEPRMVTDGFSGADVQQNKLGNCWFLSAVSAVASNEYLMRHVVKDSGAALHGDLYSGGPYTFRFFFNGVWTEVSVDDRIPCRRDRPRYTSSTDKDEFWMALLEKAYAKLHGGYDNIAGGRSHRALTELTGGISRAEKMSKVDLDELCQLANHPCWSVCLGSHSTFPEGNSRDGIQSSHAYTVMGSVRFSYPAESREVQLLRLRNPWGAGTETRDTEYTGDWGRNSSKWDSVDSATKSSIGFETDIDGIFFVEDSAIPELFSTAYFSFLSPQFVDVASDLTWTEKRLGLGDCVLVQPTNSSQTIIYSFLQCIEQGNRIEFNDLKTKIVTLGISSQFQGFDLPKLIEASSQGKIFSSKSVLNVDTTSLEEVGNLHSNVAEIFAIENIPSFDGVLPPTKEIFARFVSEIGFALEVVSKAQFSQICRV